MNGSFVRATLADAAGVVARAPLVFVVLAVIGMLPGLLGLALLDERDQRIVILFSSLLTLYLQLFATCRALDLMGAMPADYARADATEGRFPSAFGASLLSTVAILIGLVLLVVPGLLLLALWSVWMPALSADRLGATEALRRSWRLARPRLRPVLLLTLLMCVAYALVLAVAMIPVLIWADAGFLLSDIIIEPLLALAVIGSAVLWAAAYRRLVMGDPATAADAA